MNCVLCGQAAVKVKAKRPGRYKAEVVEVESEFFHCERCQEDFFSPEQMRSHFRAVKNEVRKKYGLLPPERIAEIRRKMHLTQEQLEHLLGTGPKTVVRWESGKVIQGRSHDNLLRLLERDRGLVKKLEEIQRERHQAVAV